MILSGLRVFMWNATTMSGELMDLISEEHGALQNFVWLPPEITRIASLRISHDARIIYWGFVIC